MPTKLTASQILTRVAKMVAAHRMIHAGYIGHEHGTRFRDWEKPIADPSFCRGAYGCALGSFFIAAEQGVELTRTSAYMDNMAKYQPNAFVAGLDDAEVAKAYDALNEAAQAKGLELGYDAEELTASFDSEAAIESLFEGALVESLHDENDRRQAMLDVVRDALGRAA